MAEHEHISTASRVSAAKPEKHQEHEIFSKLSPKVQINRMIPHRRIKNTEMLQNFQYCQNGFVQSAMNAYNGHYNLIIRPDDVWGAIMTQFSFYVNKHAKVFQGKIIDFERKTQFTMPTLGSIRSAPHEVTLKLMSKEIDRYLVDPEVKQWILPNFSTTTENDLVTTGLTFMATMKNYFQYHFCLGSGIPWVTLEGTLNDWENLLGRIGKLKEYKLKEWFDMLEPILQQFVNCKKGKVDVDFWQKIAHHKRRGSNPKHISGWITAFCVFDEDGNWQESRVGLSCGLRKSKWLTIDINSVPAGFAQVEVKINDNGLESNRVMLAGHVATEIKGNNRDIIQPKLGWGILVIKFGLG